LDAAPDALFTIDSSGGIVMVNSQTEPLFAYSRQELVDESIELLIPAVCAPATPQRLATPTHGDWSSGLFTSRTERDLDLVPVNLVRHYDEYAAGHHVRAIVTSDRWERCCESHGQALLCIPHRGSSSS
jgi:PAS domain-containing protein